MTWQLASFGVLALALATGFGWYERARPSAKVLALVATLAALAALGRVAFAPLPSVKPTTDIVLIAGYVLGGAPGFVVGAVGALASNVFFGQGPFTPWQMVAWGGVGLFGAALARLFGRDLGRWPLAGACACAGFAYGAFLDFHLWVLYAGQHTWAEYRFIGGQGVPFNLAHAGGNLVFCLAFGPLLVRALQRYRDRLEVVWKPLPTGTGAGAGALLALAVALGALGALGAGGEARAAAGARARAITYLAGAQNADGGFGADPGRPSSQLHTSWAVLGLAAAGRDPHRVRRNGRSPVDYIVRGIGQVRTTGDVERTIVALAAAHRSPRAVGGRDLVAELVRKRRPDGSFGGLVNQTSFAILALRASGRAARDRTVRAAAGWLAAEHDADGGFNFAGKGGRSGIDDTAAALQALVAAGNRRTRTVARAAAFLTARQNADGGLPLEPGDDSNAQSTAWAIQGLVAAGRDPGRARRGGARSPLAYLRSLQSSTGAVRYSRTSTQSPVWVTAQALTGLARKPFPIR
ncbi:MAG: energy-coupling factor transport system substrate-specific component [Solirubrobacteraceae bacterium]|nr:energy-coupling factor transport system substrate-specific component [Solirubrobacteraceae bacterium]